MDALAVFQRTEGGRTEIKTKMHGLTQSERLALIVVDGVSPYADLRNKLKGLASDRFERALGNLIKKNLIFEVLLPHGEVDADEFDSETVDRFLQQDPMDPVTIISFDPEEEFGLDDHAGGIDTAHVDVDSAIDGDQHSATDVAPAPGGNAAASPNALPTPTSEINGDGTRSRIVSVDIYLPLESRAIRGASPQLGQTSIVSPGGGDVEDGFELAAQPMTFSRPASPVFASGSKPQWGQLLIAAGIVLIVLSIMVKLLH